MNPFNVALTLHPVNGARFDVAADDALSAVVERSGGTLLATVAVGNSYAAADELRDAAHAHFLSRGHQPPTMARAVAALDGWLSGFNTEHGTDHRLSIRPGVLPDAA